MLDGQNRIVNFTKPNEVINKIYTPKIANDLFENILIKILYTISDVNGSVKNTKQFGMKIISMAEK